MKLHSFRLLWIASFFFACDNGDDPFVNSAPEIHFAGIDQSRISYDDLVNLKVTASDEDPDQIITTTWTGTDGVFSSQHGEKVQWTPPSIKGTYTFSVAVSDGLDTVSQEVGEVLVAGKFIENFDDSKGPWSVSKDYTQYSFSKGKVILKPKQDDRRLYFAGAIKNMIGESETTFPFSLHTNMSIEYTRDNSDQTDLILFFSPPTSLNEGDIYLNSVRFNIYPNKGSGKHIYLRYSIRSHLTTDLYEIHNFEQEVDEANDLWSFQDEEFNDFGIRINEAFDITFYGNQKELASISKFTLDDVTMPTHVSTLSFTSANTVSIDEAILDNTNQPLY